MKKFFLPMIMLCAATMAACGGKEHSHNEAEAAHNCQHEFAGDSTVYGLACEGCTDSVVWLLPEDASDPVKYNVLKANKNRMVHGKIKIGDRIALVVNPTDSTVADMVINCDALQGTWCYIVYPKLRTAEQMSKKMQQRMLQEMNDSIRQAYFVPREYGFTMKRHNLMTPIGIVQQSSALEDENPVVYDDVPLYAKWHIHNGRVVLSRRESMMLMATDNDSKKTKEKDAKPAEQKFINDTVSIVYLQDDSLVLRFADHVQSYYRLSNAEEANKKAREQAAKNAREAAKNITEKASEALEQVQKEGSKK